MTKPRWTKDRRAALTAYVSDIAALIGLRDWDIRIDWEPSEEGTCATMTPAANQRRATLRLGPAFLIDTPVDQRDTIVHELVHCHLFALHEVVRTTCERVLEPQAAQVADVAVNCAVESATDALAGALAVNMPLPNLLGVPAAAPADPPVAAPAAVIPMPRSGRTRQAATTGKNTRAARSRA